MTKTVSEKAILGVPNLKIEKRKICGDGQIGKQAKMLHKKLQHLTTATTHGSHGTHASKKCRWKKICLYVC